MASTGIWLRWQSNNPFIRYRLPGPQLPARTASWSEAAASSTLFASIFAVYRQRHPGIDVELVEEHGSVQLEPRLRASDIDFASALLPVPTDFEWALTRREPLVALLPADHPLRKARSVTLADLRAMPLILFGSGFALHRIILDACHEAGFKPLIAAQSSQIDFMIELVSTCVGVAFLPRMIASQRRHPAVHAVLLDAPGTEWSIAMAWRRDAYLSEAAKAWLALVQEIPGTGASTIPDSAE